MFDKSFQENEFLMEINELITSARESKGLLMRELAALIEVDIATVSKFEKGDRNPTRPQIEKLANVLDLDLKQLLTLWLRDKLVNDMKGEDVSLQALKLAEKKIKQLQKV